MCVRCNLPGHLIRNLRALLCSEWRDCTSASVCKCVRGRRRLIEKSAIITPVAIVRACVCCGQHDRMPIGNQYINSNCEYDDCVEQLRQLCCENRCIALHCIDDDIKGQTAPALGKSSMANARASMTRWKSIYNMLFLVSPSTPSPAE